MTTHSPDYIIGQLPDDPRVDATETVWGYQQFINAGWFGSVKSIRRAVKSGRLEVAEMCSETGAPLWTYAQRLRHLEARRERARIILEQKREQGRKAYEARKDRQAAA